VAHAEASAKTVEAAVVVAAAKLGLRSDQVDVEVLEDPVPSTFGYIGSPARVRVTSRSTAASTSDQPQPPSAAPASAPGGLTGSSAPTYGGLSDRSSRPGEVEPASRVETTAARAGGGSAGLAASADGRGVNDIGDRSAAVGRRSASPGGGPSAGPDDHGPAGSEASGSRGGGSTVESGGVGRAPSGSVGRAQSAEIDAADAEERPTATAAAVGNRPAAATPTAKGSPTPAHLGVENRPVPTDRATEEPPVPAPDGPSDRPVPSGPSSAEEQTSQGVRSGTMQSPPSVPALEATTASGASSPPAGTTTSPTATGVAGTVNGVPSPTSPSGDASGMGGSTTRSDVAEPTIARPPRRSRDEPLQPEMVELDTERAGDFLEGLLDALDVDGDITTWIDEAGGHIDLEGADLDTLIGPNGETLDALQELTRLAVLRQSKRRVRLLLDINGFRARQRAQLESIVRATVEQVIKTRQDHEFEPMTPAERKIIHDVVAAIDGAHTESLGEEPNRRVIIRPT